MKKVLLTTFLSAFAVAAMAQGYQEVAVVSVMEIDQEIPKGYQQDVNATYERITERGPYLTNRFFDNWFIGVGGGVNMYFGKYDKDASKTFSGRLAPALDINLGKWFTPSVGMRVQYTGLKAKGFSREMGPYTDGAEGHDGLYPKQFDVMSIHGDFLWNVSNGISGYKEDRFWDFVPFVGFGYAKSKKGDCCYEDFAMSAGLLNVMRLGNSVDLTLEARGMMVKGGFDHFVEESNYWDCMLSLTAGIQFKFGPAGGFKRPIYVAPADYTPYNQRIMGLERELGSANMRADRLQNELNSERNKPKQTVVESNDVPASLQVFFVINSSVISDQGMLNLERIAKTIKATPDQKYTVVGYADSATGTPSYNQTLSRQRAETVVKTLTDKFGVPASQLKMEYKGGVSMYKKNDLDRTVIIAQ